MGSDDIQRIQSAPLIVRLIALYIDGLVLIVPASAFSSPMADLWFSDGLTSLLVSPFMVPVRLLPGALLLALLEWKTGKTVGKAVMGIRVAGVEDGQPIGLVRAIGRRAIMTLESYVAFIPSLILIPFTRGFDGHLGDRLTGAIVSRDEDVARTSPGRQATSVASD